MAFKLLEKVKELKPKKGTPEYKKGYKDAITAVIKIIKEVWRV